MAALADRILKYNEELVEAEEDDGGVLRGSDHPGVHEGRGEVGLILGVDQIQLARDPHAEPRQYR
eukprot:3440155-Prymnesium_polylepis.1